ncbi:hypothetical protein B7463_g1096, partial [Scytalidium lignicola]
MTPPKESKTEAGSGYDLEMATNCLGSCRPTVLLEPILRYTATSINPTFATIRESVHPDMMSIGLQRYMPSLFRVVVKPIFQPPAYGAYSELYAGFSPELTKEHNGGYIIAWGQIAHLPAAVSKGPKKEAEGGSGKAQKFVEYLSRETASYLC